MGRLLSKVIIFKDNLVHALEDVAYIQQPKRGYMTNDSNMLHPTWSDDKINLTISKKYVKAPGQANTFKFTLCHGSVLFTLILSHYMSNKPKRALL